MTEAFLLAMQAAGMIVDYIGQRGQIEMGRMGQKLEEAGIDANLSQTRLESADASLQAMKKLRQNLGSQAVLMAARGNSMAGSGAIIGNESIGNFQSDERTRRMNLLNKEAGLRAGKVLSGLHQLTSETQLGQSLTKRFFDKLPTDPEVWKKTGSAVKKGFGFTEIGS